MKTNSKTVRAILLTTSLVALMSVTGNASAASACKGLENAACNSAASCGWVEGYERKDGRKVNAFCRTKSSKAKRAKTSNSASKQTSK